MISRNDPMVKDEEGNLVMLDREDPFWFDSNGHLLEYVDWPTDGPLFKDHTEEEPDFQDLQLEPDDFEDAVARGEIRLRTPHNAIQHIAEEWDPHLAETRDDLSGRVLALHKHTALEIEEFLEELNYEVYYGTETYEIRFHEKQ